MKNKTIFFAALTPLCAASLVAPAAADRLRSTLDQPLSEVSHTVDVTITEGVATYTVQRVFANEGALADEVLLEITLPKGAAATGLRIRAGEVWHEGDLMDAQEAAKLYTELTGSGVYDPKDPALLFWISQDLLYLQMFPVFPGKTSTVEYTLTVPTQYIEGRYYLSYPQIQATEGLSTPVVRVHSAHKGARVFLDERLMAVDTPLALVPKAVRLDGAREPLAAAPPDPLLGTAVEGWRDEGFFRLSQSPAPIDQLAARLGQVEISEGKGAFRLEMDAAPELAPLPQKLSVVFVVDASHSQGKEGIEAQLALAKAFLSHVPDARFEVVLFRRFASRLAKDFVEAKRFDELVKQASDKGMLSPGNGSALEEGLLLAASALSGRRGPTEIVVFSDGALRTTFKNPSALKALSKAPKKTVVHLALYQKSAEKPTEERDDKAPLSEIARKFGGVLLSVAGDPVKHQAEAADLMLGLVRPVRIDHFQIKAAGLEETLEVPGVFKEGQGFRAMGLVEKAPARVILEGMLWSTPWRRVVRAEKVFSRKTAAFVFSEGFYEDLSEKEQRRLAYQSGAVSPVTSYLAIEPGVRPSKIGLDRGGGTLGLGGAGGFGLRGTGFGGGGSGRTPPDLAALLAKETDACQKKHPAPPGWSATLEVETTYDEVVDVALQAKGAKEPLAGCLVEAAWGARLTEEYNLERESFSLSF